MKKKFMKKIIIAYMIFTFIIGMFPANAYATQTVKNEDCVDVTDVNYNQEITVMGLQPMDKTLIAEDGVSLLGGTVSYDVANSKNYCKKNITNAKATKTSANKLKVTATLKFPSLGKGFYYKDGGKVSVNLCKGVDNTLSTGAGWSTGSVVLDQTGNHYVPSRYPNYGTLGCVVTHFSSNSGQGKYHRKYTNSYLYQHPNGKGYTNYTWTSYTTQTKTGYKNANLYSLGTKTINVASGKSVPDNISFSKTLTEAQHKKVVAWCKNFNMPTEVIDGVTYYKAAIAVSYDAPCSGGGYAISGCSQHGQLVYGAYACSCGFEPGHSMTQNCSSCTAKANGVASGSVGSSFTNISFDIDGSGKEYINDPDECRVVTYGEIKIPAVTTPLEIELYDYALDKSGAATDEQLNKAEYAEKEVNSGASVSVVGQWGKPATYKGYSYKSTNPGETFTVTKDTEVIRYFAPTPYTATCYNIFRKNGVEVTRTQESSTKTIYHGESVSGSAWGTTSPNANYTYASCTKETCNASNVVVYRYFDLKSFTIRYHSNDGADKTVDQKVYVGDSTVMLATGTDKPWTRTSSFGSGFWKNAGWSATAGATNVVNYAGGSTHDFNSAVSAGQTLHLYAVWQPSLNVQWDDGISDVSALGATRRKGVATYHSFGQLISDVNLAIKSGYHLKDVSLNGLTSKEIIQRYQEEKSLGILGDCLTASIQTSSDAADPTKYVYKNGTTTDISGCVVKEGDKLDYVIKIRNSTAVPRDYTITDVLDLGVTYVNGTQSVANGGNTFTACADGKNSGTLTWEVKQLPAGEEYEVKFTVIVNENKVGKQLLNSAHTVEYAIPLLFEAENVEEDSNEVANYVMPGPQKHIRKTATSEDVIDDTVLVEGDTAVYTIAFKNPLSSAGKFMIEDTLPKGVTPVAVSDSGKISGQTVTWDSVTVNGGMEKVLSVDIKVTDEAKGTAVVNKADVTCLDSNRCKITSNEVKFYNMKAPEKSAYLTLHEDGSVNTQMDEIDTRVIRDGVLVTYRIKWENPTGIGRTLLLKDTVPEYTRIATAADLDRAMAGIDLSEELSYVGGGSFLISDGGVYDEATRGITWEIQGQGAADDETPESGYVEFSVVILKPAQDLIVENTASLTLVSPTGMNENNPTMDSNTVINPVLKTPKKVALRPDGQDVTNLVVNDGEEIEYHITFKNPAKEEKNFIVTDIVPAFTSLVDGSISDGGTYDSGENLITWTMTLLAGEEKTVSFKVMVLEEAQNETVKNTATVVVDDAKKDTNNSTSTDIFILEDPKKAVMNMDGEDINGIVKRVGDIITYNIVYKNPASMEKTATVTDKLPEGVEFIEATHQGSYDVENAQFMDAGSGYGVTYDAETHTVVWTIPTAANCQEMASVLVRIKEGAENTILKNTATVYIPDASKNTNEVVTPVIDNPVKKATDAAGQDLHGNFVTPGEEIVYTIEVTNPATEAKLAYVTDVLPEGVDFVSADMTGIYDANMHSVFWKEVPIEAQGTLTFTITVRVNDLARSEIISNEAVFRIDEAVVSSELSDGGEGGPKSYVTTKYALNSRGDDIDGDIITVGNTLVYKISYKNITDTERHFTIYDILPEGVEILDIGDGGFIVRNPIEGLDGYGIAEDRTVAWQFYVPAGEEGYVTVTVKATGEVEDILYNHATIMVTDPNGGVPFIKDTNEVKNPVIEHPVKMVFNEQGDEITDRMVTTGDTITYKITYENPADEVKYAEIRDFLPKEVKYISCDYDGEYNEASHSVIWKELETEPGERMTVSVVVKIKDSAAGKVVSNKGTLYMDEAVISTRAKTLESSPEEPVPSDDETTDNYVACKKSYDMNGNDITDEIVKVGDKMTYRIKYKNTSSVEKEYIIKDTLPDEVDYVSATGNPDVKGKTLTWNMSAPAGTEGSVDIVVTINEKGYGKKIENKADITEIIPDSSEPPYTITTTTCTNYPFDEDDFVKSVKNKNGKDMNGSAVTAGDNLYYHIKLVNPSDNKETFVVSDALPKEVKYISATKGASYDKEAHTVSWELELEGGAQADLEICVKVKSTVDSGTVKNKAHVITEGGEADSNEVFTYVFMSPVKSMRVGAKELSDGDEVVANSVVTFVIEYNNPTEQERTIAITDTLDSKIVDRVLEISDGGTLENGTITWYVDAQPNSTGEVTFSISSPSLSNEKVENTATITFDDEDLNGKTVFDTNTVYYIATLSKEPGDGSKPENNIVKTGDMVAAVFGK